MKKFLPLSVIFYCGTTIAAPNDAFLQAQNFGKPTAPLVLSASVDAVNETIDVFNIRESEGITDNSSGDYIGFNLNAAYQFHPQWSIEGSYWHREIDYSKDTNDLQTTLLAIRYLPNLNLDKNDQLALRASVWGNTANTLTKSTPTSANGYTFNHIEVKNPEDLQFQLDAIFSRKLDFMNQINLFSSIGYSTVSVDQLNVQAKYRGCDMNLTIQSNNHYAGSLKQPCTTGGVTITELNIEGDANEYGVDMQKDLDYDAYYASIGGSWNWRYQQFESQLAYQYQRLWRNDIDDRVTNFGNNAIKDNHTLGAKFSYDFNKKVTVFLKGELYQRNLIGYVPFLYNGVTASRLDKRYGLASIGLQFQNF